MVFAIVFTDTTRRGFLLKKAFIHKVKMTAIKIALKMIHKREDKRWVIYTFSQCSMRIQPIFKQIYDILAKHQEQGKINYAV